MKKLSEKCGIGIDTIYSDDKIDLSEGNEVLRGKTMKTATELTLSRNEVLEGLAEYERQVDSCQNHVSLRIHPTGNVTVDVTPSWECGEREYYHRMPCSVTIKHAQGHGQCNLLEGWSDDEGDLLPELDSVIERLEEAGYDVEMV